jgi:hypothetical protein
MHTHTPEYYILPMAPGKLIGISNLYNKRILYLAKSFYTLE